jgi:hypothetical protein
MASSDCVKLLVARASLGKNVCCWSLACRHGRPHAMNVRYRWLQALATSIGLLPTSPATPPDNPPGSVVMPGSASPSAVPPASRSVQTLRYASPRTGRARRPDSAPGRATTRDRCVPRSWATTVSWSRRLLMLSTPTMTPAGSCRPRRGSTGCGLRRPTCSRRARQVRPQDREGEVGLHRHAYARLQPSTQLIDDPMLAMSCPEGSNGQAPRTTHNFGLTDRLSVACLKATPPAMGPAPPPPPST